MLVFVHLGAQVPCTNGSASGFPCDNVDLMSLTSISDLGGTGDANDVWGWTDPLTGKEYALLGLNNGTSFIDVSDAVNPVYIGFLPTETFNSSWRDIKVIGNYAFIGSEATGHGIQSFDLTNLRTVVAPPVTFTALDVFNEIGVGRSHNVVSMEDSKHIVVVGARGTGGCEGGLIFVDISNPENMRLDGCFSEDEYSHDAVCFTYRGPDTEHYGKQICIGSNEDTQTIVDVTDKQNPVILSRTGYPLSNYTHQGWVTDDHKYLLFDDEFDEVNLGENTRTYVMDISDLDNVAYVGAFQNTTQARDHNLYIKGQYAYQANYRSGFRMLDIRNTSTANFSEVAYFDTYPADDGVQFTSAWSVYPYFESGNILVSDIQQGLFVLRPTVPFFTIEANTPIQTVIAGEDLVFNIDLKSYGGYSDAVSISLNTDIPGSTETFSSTSVSASGSTVLTISDTETLAGPYHLIIQGRGPSDNVVHDYAIAFNVMPRIYVDADVTSSGDSSRWDQAFQTLTSALSSVPASGAEIWVASGTYLPTSGTDRSISFDIPDGVMLYGGFSGTESMLSQRDITANPTILSGNIGDVNSDSDNSFHVITTSGSRSVVTLDGFTISGGNANGTGDTEGGGLLSANLATTLRDCILTDNFASKGSAIYNDGAILTLVNCDVVGLDAEMIYNNSSRIDVEGEVVLRKN